MGCGTTVIVFAVIAFIVIFALASTSGQLFGTGTSTSSGDITASTVKREALSAGAVDETGYYTDNLEWIYNQTQFEAGLKNFYAETGVQPYIYFTGEINGSTERPSDEALQAFSDSLYDQLFTDEAHILLVFFDNGDVYRYRYTIGLQAKSVIDAEAGDILENYIDRYYSDTSLSYEQAFSKAFNDTAERIMTVTKSPWIPVLIVAGVILLIVIGFVWWRHAKKQKNLEAQQTEDMLNTPLDKFGDKEAEELGKKYDDDPNNDPT